MAGFKILHSDDFINAAIAWEFLTVQDKNTKKYHTYNMKAEMLSLALIDIQDIKTFSDSAQNTAVLLTAGVLLASAGIFPALAALYLGGKLPKHSKDEYIIQLTLIDGKSLVLQLSQKIYEQLLKYVP